MSRLRLDAAEIREIRARFDPARVTVLAREFCVEPAVIWTLVSPPAVAPPRPIAPVTAHGYHVGLMAALRATRESGTAVPIKPWQANGVYRQRLKRAGLRLRTERRDGAIVAWCERR